MRVRRFKRRAAVALAAAAIAGGVGLAGAGTASASTGGGCGGSAWRQACISVGSHGVNSDAYTNFASNACAVDVMLWDYTTNTRWDNWRPCGTGWTHYQGTLLGNPTPGHDYKSELRVYWQGGSGYDYNVSPDLID
ncbi:hypothetical protein ACFOSC_21455 [Streptantibioticus rubrisoli]|uniref:Secreted protein n=1 Tax=Streptantibioticus rubrisoli TaxID=1387313 RepID=A0ABT1P869_9ACTN|nr:hypothetical protein [Streptantibioticus rubrisoli]MCQ4040530.1 hypothetical protein [Streptantibioticus rubrisoli]